MLRSAYPLKTKGLKPRDPANMLPSTLLMTKCGMSFDDWVRSLRTIPIYAILSGFCPLDTPGAGTFYGFFCRLWSAPFPHKTGRALYMFSAADSPYDLPVYPRLFKASQHDSVSWICGYQEFHYWYPQWNLEEALLDSADDALPIHTMLEVIMFPPTST